jgi:hypothetical protein
MNDNIELPAKLITQEKVNNKISEYEPKTGVHDQRLSAHESASTSEGGF